MTTKADTYTHHDKAFEKVSAYVLVKDGKLVGTIAFKFPRDGMGRLYAYLHLHGTGMVRGSASGCGYDKRTAAIHAAAHALPFPYQMSDAVRDDYVSPDIAPWYDAVRLALCDREIEGRGWETALRALDLDVFQAV